MQRCIANHKDMQQYISEDFYFLPQQQQHPVNQWCFQFPILGFNSGCYDLNLIKKHFVTHVAQFDDVKGANKQNKIMFMSYGQVCGHL